jgi:cAMP-dependent protein kinase regulator
MKYIILPKGSDEEVKKVDLDVKKKAQKTTGKREGVSSEPMGQKKDFKPRVIPKTQDQKNKIRSKLIQSILFNHLDSDELEIIINAMEEKRYEYISLI